MEEKHEAKENLWEIIKTSIIPASSCRPLHPVNLLPLLENAAFFALAQVNISEAKNILYLVKTKLMLQKC